MCCRCVFLWAAPYLQIPGLIRDRRGLSPGKCPTNTPPSGSVNVHWQVSCSLFLLSVLFVILFRVFRLFLFRSSSGKCWWLVGLRPQVELKLAFAATRPQALGLPEVEKLHVMEQVGLH